MSSSVIRPGFPTASPYMIFRDPSAALSFYSDAMGAEIVSKHVDGAGLMRHAEMRIGDSTFMMTAENPAFAFMRSVEQIGDSPVQFFLYVDKVDERFARALKAGATEIMAVAEQPYGRSGGVKDPFGHTWWLSTHKEMK